MQDQVLAACRALVARHADFWLLAAITDYSFEEGTRSRSLQEPVQRLQSAGAPRDLLDDIRAGINGTLARELATALPDARVSSNKSRVPDLLVESPTGDARAAIEVKLIYDLTYTKYYRSAAEDHVKLTQYVEANPGTKAFAVAFLVQLPSMDYPAGHWYGRPKLSRGRWDQVVRSGIDKQMDELCMRVGSRPNVEPSVRTQLADSANENVLGVAQRWFDDVFKPSTSWSFDPSQHLANAAVGCAIWEVA